MSIGSELLRSATSDSIAGRVTRSVVFFTLGIAFGMTGCSSLRDISGVQADSIAMKDTSHSNAGTVAPALYVDAFGCCVEVYSPSGKFRYQIPPPTRAFAPGFISVGPDGKLYVPNNLLAFGGGTYAYAPGSTQPTAHLLDPYGGDDQASCVDSKGTVYVLDYNVSGAGWLILVYANGATSPTSTITGGDGTEQPTACDVDPNGNIFVTFYYSGGSLSSIKEFPPNGTPRNFGFTSMVNMDQLVLDDRGDFVVAGSDLKGNWGVWVFKRNSHRLLRELPIQGGTGNWGVAFSTRERRLYVTSAGPIQFDEYDWPTGTVLRTFSWKGPSGSPPESAAVAPIPR